MHKKQFIFIDDSGDPGFKGAASSSAFVMAGAVIMSPKIARKLDEEIIELKRRLGWREEEEFKFNKSSKKIRLEFLDAISKYEFKIYAVYVNKSNYPALYQFADEPRLYNWTIKELLNIIPLNNATIKIDGKYGGKYKLRLRAYIRKKLNISERKIYKFDVQDSRKNNLIQLADLIAGSINRSFQGDKTDSKEYIRVVKNKIVDLRELDLNKPVK